MLKKEEKEQEHREKLVIERLVDALTYQNVGDISFLIGEQTIVGDREEMEEVLKKIIEKRSNLRFWKYLALFNAICMLPFLVKEIYVWIGLQ